MQTTVCNKVDVEHALRKVLHFLHDVTEKSIDLVWTNLETEGLCTRLQLIFNVRHEGWLERAIHQLVVGHALLSEKLAPGGFNRFLDLVGRSNSNQAPPSQFRSLAAFQPDVERLLKTTVTDGIIASMLHEAINLVGLGGKVLVEKSLSNTLSVELVNGYTFNISSLLGFDQTVIKPRVFCIDGYIETVSEIHHLLEAAVEAKEPCILFVRGIADDVKQTLKVNHVRGSLRVFPVGVQYDFEGMNTLVDVAAVSGTDVVSSLKGDLIASIKYQEAPRVDQVTLYKGKIVIFNRTTTGRVSLHLRDLVERRANETDDLKCRLLDLRIRSLLPCYVVIRLPDDRDFVVRSQMVDKGLRLITSMVEHGVDPLTQLPAAVELGASYHAEQCLAELTQLGAAINLVL